VAVSIAPPSGYRARNAPALIGRSFLHPIYQAAASLSSHSACRLSARLSHSLPRAPFVCTLSFTWPLYLSPPHHRYPLPATRLSFALRSSSATCRSSLLNLSLFSTKQHARTEHHPILRGDCPALAFQPPGHHIPFPTAALPSANLVNNRQLCARPLRNRREAEATGRRLYSIIPTRNCRRSRTLNTYCVISNRENGPPTRARASGASPTRPRRG
jgi:hypothetical protein